MYLKRAKNVTQQHLCFVPVGFASLIFMSPQVRLLKRYMSVRSLGSVISRGVDLPLTDLNKGGDESETRG